MTKNRAALFLVPIVLMVLVTIFMAGIETWMAAFGKTEAARQTLGRAAITFPYIAAAAVGVLFLFASVGSPAIKFAGAGVIAGSILTILVAMTRETVRLMAIAGAVPSGKTALSYLDPATMIGAGTATLTAVFASRVALMGNAAFRKPEPRRVHGERAIYGDATWMKLPDAAELLPASGGVVIGENYRVDRDDVAGRPFREKKPKTWGAGGKSPLLCFDGSFGSSHGIVFAGSGGFKTTSVVIPSALKWGSSVVVLDPSKKIARLVRTHRESAGRDVHILDPKRPETGVNVLDWIGRFGGSKEEDIAAVASWIVSDNARASMRDDFFRGSGLQLITALIADVCLSGNTEEKDQTLRQVRKNLAEPEPKLRERLQRIYENSSSDFVKENVAAFVNMTPETFSGVYGHAVKETHWLSYANYAALVSGSSFTTDDIADGKVDVFIAIDTKTLETHAALARVIIGAFLNAIYNREGEIDGRALFLLDEVARLGFMRIMETARDDGRKYGITLTMIYQSIGQMREAYGGQDGTSKWFESASWISFAAINDPDTAEYISKRCGTTTVEIDQVSRSTQSRGSSRTRSKQLAPRPLILPDEVLRMRADEQIVFTAGNPPIRCGRAIWFRRADMRSCIPPDLLQKGAKL